MKFEFKVLVPRYSGLGILYSQEESLVVIMLITHSITIKWGENDN